MEQIIGIILMIGIGWLLERGSEKRKKGRKRSVRPVQPPELPKVVRVAPDPVSAPRQAESFLDYDMPRDSYKPVEVPREKPAEIVIEEDPEETARIERWRQAIIDTEILSRRF